MSCSGSCYDNAAMERFFWSLKHEWTNHESFENLASVRLSQVHRNVLQSRPAAPDAGLSVTQPLRSRTRPDYIGANKRPAGVRKSWAIAPNGELE